MTADIWARLATEVGSEVVRTLGAAVTAVPDRTLSDAENEADLPHQGRGSVPRRARRVVVYAAGDARRVAQQQDACAVHAAEAGLTVVGLAVDDEIGHGRGWLSALAMLASGDVDAVLVEDRVVIPGLIVAAVPSGQRRITPVQRGGAR